VYPGPVLDALEAPVLRIVEAVEGSGGLASLGLW
jgi:hypothetical protein